MRWNFIYIPILEHKLSSPVIIYPNGGETLSGIVEIEWIIAQDSYEHNVYYNIYYSPDNGKTWIVIITDLPSQTNSYSWDTKSIVNGYNYLVNIVAECSNGLIEEDYSDHVFSISNEVFTTTSTPPNTTITTIVVTTESSDIHSSSRR